MISRAWLVSWIAITMLVACGDDGGGGDDAPAIDASTSDVPDANPGPTPDADPTAGPDASVGVACGEAFCDSTQECCVQQGGATCVAGGTCQGTTISCDGPEDCPQVGQVCCLDFGGQGGGGAECTAPDACDTPTCETADDCPDPGQECCAFGPVMVCSAQCPGP